MKKLIKQRLREAVEASYIETEVNRIKSLPIEVEDGATFNLDGTKYNKGGLVVPAGTDETTQIELTTEKIFQFIQKNKARISGDNFKVGMYKFPNENRVSIDLNIIVDKKYLKVALEFGRLAGQESLFDLDTFENIKTGSDGKTPKKFTPAEFAEIAKSLAVGKLPKAVMA